MKLRSIYFYTIKYLLHFIQAIRCAQAAILQMEWLLKRTTF